MKERICLSNCGFLLPCWVSQFHRTDAECHSAVWNTENRSLSHCNTESLISIYTAINLLNIISNCSYYKHNWQKMQTDEHTCHVFACGHLLCIHEWLLRWSPPFSSSLSLVVAFSAYNNDKTSIIRLNRQVSECINFIVKIIHNFDDSITVNKIHADGLL